VIPVNLTCNGISHFEPPNYNVNNDGNDNGKGGPPAAVIFPYSPEPIANFMAIIFGASDLVSNIIPNPKKLVILFMESRTKIQNLFVQLDDANSTYILIYVNDKSKSILKFMDIQSSKRIYLVLCI
jgi:hypothetical protein